MLGAEPLAQIQQYMNIVDGRTKFIAMCNVIRNKYYPATSIEKETMLEWISRSTDEYGLKVWFSLWQEAIDILRLVDEASIPKNRHFLRYMETGMTNPHFKVYFGTLRAGMVPDLRVAALPGALRLRFWREIRDEMILYLERDPSLESHLRSLPKSSVSSSMVVISAQQAVTTGATNSCWNCGQVGHRAMECKALRCGRCNKAWSSEYAVGFHRMSQGDKCPNYDPSKKRQRSQGASFTKPITPQSQNQPFTSAIDSKAVNKQFKAKFKDERSEGFKAAVAMLKSGKSVADLESSALGKHKRSS